MNEGNTIAKLIRIRRDALGAYHVLTWKNGRLEAVVELEPFDTLTEAGDFVADLLSLASEEMYHDRIIASGLMTAEQFKRARASATHIAIFVRARENVCRFAAMVIALECQLTSATADLWHHTRNAARLAAAGRMAVQSINQGA